VLAQHRPAQEIRAGRFLDEPEDEERDQHADDPRGDRDRFPREGGSACRPGRRCPCACRSGSELLHDARRRGHTRWPPRRSCRSRGRCPW
jgi:hypothetical protein